MNGCSCLLGPEKHMLEKPRTIIEIYPNGDPYGSGFEASESTDGGNSWFYRGDVGARTREFWRNYCRKNNCTLRYR